MLLKACPALEEFHASTDRGAFFLPGEWISSKAPMPLALRSLVLRNAHFLQPSLEALLVVTPQLEELQLINLARGNGCYPEEGQISSKYDWHGLLRHARALPFRLRSFHFSVRDEVMTHADLRDMLLGVCPQSTEWTLWASDLQPMMIQCLNELPNHVTALDLYWHDRSGCLSGDGLHQYLCVSSHLMHLRTFGVGFDIKQLDLYNRAGLHYSDASSDPTSATTISRANSGHGTRTKPRTWACHNLRTLYIEFHGHGDAMIRGPVHSRIVFGYIAAVCPQLRDLHIKVPWACRSDNEVYYPALCFRLEGGLCQLARLQFLTRLRFQDWTSGTSRYDLNWMTPLGQSPKFRRKRQEVMAQWDSWLREEEELGMGRMRTSKRDSGIGCIDICLHDQLQDLGLLSAVKTTMEEIDKDGYRCWPEIQGVSLTGKFEQRPHDELQGIFPSKRLSIF